ncbi:hypothetical protein Tsubulata_047964 [Turnera subulata]|uniref:AIPP2-like SPOC-like domain-containing protein n=1 Tax=Turnera subulata TaxID=218843 RepID=A0A9Q0GFF9_9ROSI|nr:hypothetical protein Tsubulata_047964 [Turnera subulata]
MRKSGENAKVRFLPAPEVIKFHSGTGSGTRIRVEKRCSRPTNHSIPPQHATSYSSLKKQAARSSAMSNHITPTGFASVQSTPDRFTSAPEENVRPRKPVASVIRANPSSASVRPQENCRCHCSKTNLPLDDEKPHDGGDGKSKRVCRLDSRKESGSNGGKEIVHMHDSVNVVVPATEVRTSSHLIKQSKTCTSYPQPRNLISGKTDVDVLYALAVWKCYNALHHSLLQAQPMSCQTFPAGVSDNDMTQENDSQVIDPNVHKPLPLPGDPALEVVWKGSFEVVNLHGFLHSPPDLKLCEGFVAHPPVIVARKSYEFSKKIAGVMQFSLHPRLNSWPKAFQTDPPDVNDIALYFYPGQFERSRNKYSRLLKYIEKNDLALRSCMGSVELLVFPSALLVKDFQKLKGSFFMWGVFQRMKETKRHKLPEH